ncbi:hypothetical protein PYW08_007917 [Mythimna loreyi]|uniref:Uncharacterized protein n=1 Tax=Mythimna loreyi TaxID=667449 RepID=A0ACC2QI55_9NEOP|nr:hypothetical protein PYW08_007917 [Mythimna loreyi]
MIISYSVVLYLCVTLATASSDLRCNVRTRIETGWVCGLLRQGEYDVEYASFRGIPYARQPLGELRFRELQPAIPWPHHLDASEEGPICPQHDELYDRMVKPNRGMSESCIYANVHVPLEALPDHRADDDVYHTGYVNNLPNKGFPIFVFIHGGAFQLGSGDTDLHGPEYLVSKGIIVITFNYRLNVFGFLSLNNPKIPGNAGLRDQVTLLRWVQRNARAFGGDPGDVTIAGQSAGATIAHLLALSNVTKGLFKRVILMSGSAEQTFYTASPIYASIAAARYLQILGINSTDPDIIHDRLVNTPLKDILNANSAFQYESGLVSFLPVIEAKYPGIERIIDDDPRRLIERGRGNEFPIVMGFADEECEFFKRRILYAGLLRKIEAEPSLILPARIPFTTPPNVARELGFKVINRNFVGKLNIEEYMDVCRDVFFGYPAFKVSQWRAEMNAAPVYLYQFSYEADFSTVKVGLKLQYNGTAHVEDLTNIFRGNAVLGGEKTFPPRNEDDFMKDWMTQFVVNFIRCNNPTCGEPGWPPVQAKLLNYQNIRKPGVYVNTLPTKYQRDMIQFYDRIDQIARNSSLEVITPPPLE